MGVDFYWYSFRPFCVINRYVNRLGHLRFKLSLSKEGPGEEIGKEGKKRAGRNKKAGFDQLAEAQIFKNREGSQLP